MELFRGYGVPYDAVDAFTGVNNRAESVVVTCKPPPADSVPGYNEVACMRTRLLRPEFWADSRMADLPYATRLTYMGLWGLADDEGFLDWDLRDIGANLYRYESPKRRESKLTVQLDELVTAGRVQVLPCGIHAIIPSIPRYRIKGGNQTDQYRRKHQSTCSDVLVRTSTDKYLSVSVTDTVTESVTGTVPAAWNDLGKKFGSNRGA